uniref:Peptidylprolyl isomerase n=1 Tax=Chlamydomonas leiostraca TaxID=1034604 RepID=A0A7S0RB62_9CHLO|mmetsp:Transcript_181/g.411  ORF Transcript_181/g.411 Transcript_181/m.411 type:complete len:217 (+) Transcript_181:29-679(+)
MKLVHRSCQITLLAVLAFLSKSVDSARDGAFIGYTEKNEDGGVIRAESQEYTHIVMTTSYGKIRIRPRKDVSPKIVSLVENLARKAVCNSCHFYRHEPVPVNWGMPGNWDQWGPPYALLQGSLADMEKKPEFEGNPVVKKGDVCIIPNCSEFFIAKADHDEWGTAHSVWGKVEDDESWATIAAIPMEPFTTLTDSGNITTRWLTPDAHIPFKLTLE